MAGAVRRRPEVARPPRVHENRPSLHLIGRELTQALAVDRTAGFYRSADDEPFDLEQSRRIEAGQVRAVLVAVERGVEVRPGVGDHLDRRDIELDARCVALARRPAGEERPDSRRRESGQRDQSIAKLVAQLDHPSVRHLHLQPTTAAFTTALEFQRNAALRLRCGARLRGAYDASPDEQPAGAASLVAG